MTLPERRRSRRSTTATSTTRTTSVRAATTPADAAAFAWRWANAPTPYDTDGSIDLARRLAHRVRRLRRPRAADRLADPLLPRGWRRGVPQRLGRRRDRRRSCSASTAPRWSSGAIATGSGQIASAAHEQPDTGSFLLHAFGERLLLDPGYLTYEQRGLVGQGARPQPDPRERRRARRPVHRRRSSGSTTSPGCRRLDGQATISASRDTPFLDTARVTSRYAGTKVDRRFFFVDDRYLVVADTLQAAAGPDPDVHVAAARQRRRHERRHVHARRRRAASGPTARRASTPRSRPTPGRSPCSTRDTQPRGHRPGAAHPHHARREQHRDRADDPRPRRGVPEPVGRDRADDRDAPAVAAGAASASPTPPATASSSRPTDADGTVTIHDTPPRRHRRVRYSDAARPVLGRGTASTVGRRRRARSACA